MRYYMSFQILGTGSFLPQRVVTNEELSQMVETSDQWITQRVGVKTRHVCTSETALDLGAEAARRALEAAHTQPQELDLIIAATISADTISPGLGGMVQKRLGAACPAFDINAACPGFLFALDIAAGFFARKAVKKVLVVSAERMSGLLDWSDRGTCCIFGDGAGAAVLGEGEGYAASELHTQGGDDVINIPTAWDSSPFYGVERDKNCVHMKGQDTYKFAVTSMVRDIRSVMEQAGITGGQVKAVIPHQANLRIISEARRRSRHSFDVDVNSSDKIVTLSTCTRAYGQTSNQRFVVMGRLLRPGESIGPVTVTSDPNHKQPSVW